MPVDENTEVQGFALDSTSKVSSDADKPISSSDKADNSIDKPEKSITTPDKLIEKSSKAGARSVETSKVTKSEHKKPGSKPTSPKKNKHIVRAIVKVSKNTSKDPCFGAITIRSPQIPNLVSSLCSSGDQFILSRSRTMATHVQGLGSGRGGIRRTQSQPPGFGLRVKPAAGMTPAQAREYLGLAAPAHVA